MTLWVFLSQVMSIHHGCVSAVAKLITYRLARGQRACSAETGAYCIARDKLDEDSMQALVKASGEAIEAKCPDQWLWLGHRVITADGATVTMADTPDNRPDRYEPRVLKRRQKNYKLMQKPRHDYKPGEA